MTLTSIPEVAAVLAHFGGKRIPCLLLVLDRDESGRWKLKHVGATPAKEGPEADEIMDFMAHLFLSDVPDDWHATGPLGGPPA